MKCQAGANVDVGAEIAGNAVDAGADDAVEVVAAEDVKSVAAGDERADAA